MACKTFCLLWIPKFSGKVMQKQEKIEKTGKCKAFCFSSKRNNIIVYIAYHYVSSSIDILSYCFIRSICNFYIVLGLFIVIFGVVFYALCTVSAFYILTLKLVLLCISKFCYNIFLDIITTYCLVRKKKSVADV